MGPRGLRRGEYPAQCPRPGFSEWPLTSGCPPGITAHQWESVKGGAAVLRASGASVVARRRPGPRELGLIGVPAGGRLSPGALVEARRHPSRPIGAEKIAVVLFE